jgi:LysM repeat protein
LISEREKLEFESLPEFVREPRQSAREAYTTKPSREIPTAKPLVAPPIEEGELAALPKTAELEALWPGVSHEIFQHGPKKGPSFYLTLGFMAGAVVSLVGIWGFAAVSHMASSGSNSKEIVVQSGQNGSAKGIGGEGGAVVTQLASRNVEPETVVPLSTTCDVGSGDTLAGIALKNYRRATPRLLDEICRANNMKNANVLNLGQKLLLPEYHPQARQIATGGSTVQQ